ncbi:MAG: cation-translocating P-type ATPase C-terminal domain-containing protein, partial [Deltaproteobacteria bacterium]
MSILTLGIFSLELYGFDSSLKKAQTMAFTTLVLVQLLHSFNCQNQQKSMFAAGPLTNPYLIFANCVSLFLLCLSIYMPPLSEAFELESLGARDWIHAAAASLLIIVSVEIQKWFR